MSNGGTRRDLATKESGLSYRDPVLPYPILD